MKLTFYIFISAQFELGIKFRGALNLNLLIFWGYAVAIDSFERDFNKFAGVYIQMKEVLIWMK